MDNFSRQVHYWAHMLDETKHLSYYDVYMASHPEDKLPALMDSLMDEFARCLKKNKINVAKCANVVVLADALKKIACKYYWERIPALTYGAIISRYVAMMDAAKGQKYIAELDYEDVRRGVSRKKIEECLDIICHNTNVLEANNFIVYNTHNYEDNDKSKACIRIFEKHHIPKVKHYDDFNERWVEDYFIAMQLYCAWASYGKGRAGEQYVCDSDNGPEALKKVLNSIEYDADEILLVAALNKAVDVVHFRSDLANAFLEGGLSTAALVSNLPKGFVI